MSNKNKYVYVNVYQEKEDDYEPIVTVFDNAVAAQGHVYWIEDNDYILLSSDKAPVYAMFTRRTKDDDIECFYGEKQGEANEEDYMCD